MFLQHQCFSLKSIKAFKESILGMGEGSIHLSAAAHAHPSGCLTGTTCVGQAAAGQLPAGGAEGEVTGLTFPFLPVDLVLSVRLC